MNSKRDNANVKVTGRFGNKVNIIASDPEGDPLSYEVLIKPESGNELVQSIPGATFTAIPSLGGFSDSSTFSLDFSDIHDHRNLRMYVLVRDGNGHIATATFPFQTAFAANDTTLFSVIKESSLSHKDNHVFVYPTITRDQISILFSDPGGRAVIQLFENSGRLITTMEKQSISGKHSIDLAGLFPGIYFIRVYCNEKLYHFRVVKY
jgi:hypothetical protein